MSIDIAVGQLNKPEKETMLFAKQLGVNRIHFNTPQLPGDKYWKYEDLKKLKSQCEEYELNLEAIENIPLKFYHKIMLDLPGKEEQIDNLKRTIANLGKAEIPILGYHFEPTFVWRTSYKETRGGAKVTAYNKKEALEGKNIVEGGILDAGKVKEEKMWENYKYLMDNIIPAAENAGIKLALHPSDPPVKTLAGIPRLFRSVNSFKKAMEIANSEAWGIDLCLGTFSEMEGGSDNVFDAIKYFVPHKKILYIHFRDVEGTVPDFKEAFIGDGNYNPAEVIFLLNKLNFDGFLISDHVPIMTNDSKLSHRARAHAIGYMQGLLKYNQLQN